MYVLSLLLMMVLVSDNDSLLHMDSELRSLLSDDNFEQSESEEDDEESSEVPAPESVHSGTETQDCETPEVCKQDDKICAEYVGEWFLSTNYLGHVQASGRVHQQSL